MEGRHGGATVKAKTSNGNCVSNADRVSLLLCGKHQGVIMDTTSRVCALLYCLMVAMFPCSVLAEQGKPEFIGEITIFPGLPNTKEDREDEAIDGAIVEPGPILEWNVPDSDGYESVGKSGWWGVLCRTYGFRPQCRLQKLAMTVRLSPYELEEGKTVPGRLFRWMTKPNNNSMGLDDRSERVLMVFRQAATHEGKIRLREGELTTYLHKGAEFYYPGTYRTGTMEVSIPLANDRRADLLPRVFSSSLANIDRGRSDVDVFELRIDGQRQRLPGRKSGCGVGKALRPEDYLWWAGDMDGDGKLDLILSRGGEIIFPSDDHPGHLVVMGERHDLALYLSSLAKPGELLGLAGRFRLVPLDLNLKGC